MRGSSRLAPLQLQPRQWGFSNSWHPHAAILDFVLRDGTATRVATELASRGIPFVVYTGLAPGGVSLPELARVRWHEKPASGEELISSLAELVGEDVPPNRGRPMRLGRRPPPHTRRCEAAITSRRLQHPSPAVSETAPRQPQQRQPATQQHAAPRASVIDGTAVSCAVTRVSRFYFDVRDGESLTHDYEGVEFASTHDARVDASRALAEMVKGAMPNGPRTASALGSKASSRSASRAATSRARASPG